MPLPAPAPRRWPAPRDRLALPPHGDRRGHAQALTPTPVLALSGDALRCRTTPEPGDAGVSGDDAFDLQVDDGVHVEAEALEDGVAVLVEVGGAAGLRRHPAVLDRRGDQLEGLAFRVGAVGDVPVGDGLRVLDDLEGGLHPGPLAGEGLELGPELVGGLGQDRRLEDLRPLPGVGRHPLVVGEAGVGGELGPADEQLAGLRPVLHRLQAHEGDLLAVGGVEVAHEGVARGPGAGDPAAPRDAELQRQREAGAHRPHPDGEQRHVDRGGLARALAVEQRAHDPAGDRHRADRVAEGRRRAGDAGGVGRLEAHGDAGAVPVGEGVVGALVGVGPALALARAPHVDDVRVVGADVVHVHLQLGPHARHLVGEEDVAGRRQLVEDVEPLRGGEVEADALLAAVGVLEQHVDVRLQERQAAALQQAPHGVAALDVLDLDHLGSPVGEQRRRRGHERVLRDLEDPNPLHDGSHLASPPGCFRSW